MISEQKPEEVSRAEAGTAERTEGLPEQKSREVPQPKAEPEADTVQESPEKADFVGKGHPETSAYSSGLLEEEEISELLDRVLCADDLVPDARVWHSEICSFFQRGNSQMKKANALKLIYGELDEDYNIQDGGYQVHILGQSEGIVFQADGAR